MLRPEDDPNDHWNFQPYDRPSERDAWASRQRLYGFLLLVPVLAVILAACGNADVRHDPFDPCRVVVMDDNGKGYSAKIEGCIFPDKNPSPRLGLDGWPQPETP
jgi:hypothetical protein